MRRGVGVVGMLWLALASFATAAPPEPLPYGTNDAGGVRNVLPPGSRGLSNAVELGSFLATGARPAHNSDQLPLYRDLLTAPRPFTQDTLAAHFKDAGFGVQGAVERRYSPRDDVTIVRDAAFGVPHIYGATRAGALFGIGYATAEDRLFFMDVFRHLGRGQLSSFAGGAPANRAFDALMWSVAPYTEEELLAQTRARPRGFEEEADGLRADLEAYLAGINAYIAEARLNPTKMPGEYAAIGDTDGPDDWKASDVVATASVAGAIFGVGGGSELKSALALQAARERFGRRGDRVWRDFRSVDDPESPTTVRGKRFPYALHPAKRRGLALPDPGTVETPETLKKAEAPGSTTRALGRPLAQSNALLVAARESASGHPLAVFGPQTAYFSPQVLYEQDVHAPGYEARGVAFPGVNLFVQLGRGRDYAWSATTSAQDIVDTFAVPLCDATHYRFRGECREIEVLERTNTWEPNAADPTPAGSETLTTERTELGLVIARATIGGKPHLFTRLRSTYGHETDSGVAFKRLNDPSQITGYDAFLRTAALIPFTFNWFYVDAEHLAYQNSGANPIRARRVDASLPVFGRPGLVWRRWDPADTSRSLVERSTPAAAHPSVVDQSYIADWNGKQARGYGAADGNWGYGPVYRSRLLDERARRLVAGDRKTTLPELTEAMIDAATVDLRGDAVLPWALRVIGTPDDEALRPVVDGLRAWTDAGAHRRDEDGDGAYEHSEAIRVMDAWWPRWVRGQFQPALGKPLFEAMTAVHAIDNHPNNHGDHVGSAWQSGWYSFVQKDLRTLLRRPVKGRWSRTYCGRGSLKRCRRSLERSLRNALAADPAELYGDEVCRTAGRDGEQACFDAIWHRPLGGITQPLIPWQNRPTFQQVVEITARLPRP